MFNPVEFVKIVIDLVRNPPGEALSAVEITEANGPILFPYAVSSAALKKPQIGDFAVFFENDIWTVCPRTEFFKHYEFTREPSLDEMDTTPVRTIKPL